MGIKPKRTIIDMNKNANKFEAPQFETIEMITGHSQEHYNDIAKNTTIPIQKPIEKPKEVKMEILDDLETDEKLKDLVLSLIVSENPRLSKYPFLLQAFLELMMYRLETKKSKVCMLKATINQIHVGVNITEDILHEAGMDNYIVQ